MSTYEGITLAGRLVCHRTMAIVTGLGLDGAGPDGAGHDGGGAQLPRDPRAVVLAFQGDLDIGTSPALVEEVVSAGTGCRRVIVDLAGVRFMDSTGLHTLLGAHADLQSDGVTLTIRRPCRQVRRLLELTGADRTLSIES